MSFNIDKCIEKIKNCEILKELEVKLLCFKLKEIFINEPNVI